MEATETLASPAGGADRSRSWLDRLIDLEFTQPLAFVALAVVYVASRAPWLDLGYGADPDAWRVALTAEYLWAEGDYFPSRLPGYPLHEAVTAALVKGGWVLTNLSTVAISLAGIYLFAWVARKLELPSRGVLTLGFAFAPLLWINSVATIDYMWALTFVLAAYLALLYKSPTAAGIALGLAAGFRLSSLAMLAPFWLLLLRSGRRDELRPVTLNALAVTLLAYTPILMDYGFGFLNFYDQKVQLSEFLRALGKDGLGIVGTLALLGALALSLRRLRSFPGDLVHDPQVLVWTAVIVVYFIGYARLPHEIAYLIPLFPFGFFLLSRYLSRTVLVGLLTVVVVAGFVDITSPDDEDGVGLGTFTSARIGGGMLFSDLDTLNGQRELTDELWRLAAGGGEVQRPAVIAAGFLYPQLVVRHQDELRIGIFEEDTQAISQLSDKGLTLDDTRGIKYIWLPELDAFEHFQTIGDQVYVTRSAAESIFNAFGYRPAYFGAKELPLGDDGGDRGSGAAALDR